MPDHFNLAGILCWLFIVIICQISLYISVIFLFIIIIVIISIIIVTLFKILSLERLNFSILVHVKCQ